MQKPWTTHDIPPQNGKIAVVTGPGGLGYETALALAAHGADVILAGRNPHKGAEALQNIRAVHPQAKVRFGEMDLASLASVAQFVSWLRGQTDRVDMLINNAGVMALPTRHTTTDDFETQMGVNYLGHFALTAQVLPLLQNATGARVVNLSSGLHWPGKIHFDDMQFTKRYNPTVAYSQSKLAMLMFSLEMDRRSRADNWGIMANAAHPGYARTELIANGPGKDSLQTRIGKILLESWASQTAAEGALPTLYAATSPEARGGGYYGPSKIFGLIGPPGVARTSGRARDEASARRLWEVSEQLTRVRLAPAAGMQKAAGR